ncbi:MAG: serine hydrolase [Gammaproteobacteria bacterium]|nr:serine hydrolase [Gammaproteobacteria bacterium]
MKLEWENPIGSVKDRMVRAVISRAEADGRLKPGDTVVDYWTDQLNNQGFTHGGIESSPNRYAPEGLATEWEHVTMKSWPARLILTVMIPVTVSSPHAKDAVDTKPGFENLLRRAIVVKDEPADRHSLSARMAHYKVPGLSVAIIEGCKVVEARGFGEVEVDGVAVQPDTLFQAASISKPVTALAVLRLVEQDKLSLDADVRTGLKTWMLPDSPLLKEHPVTLRTLLSHSAGLNVHGFGGYPVGAALPTTSQILDGFSPANSEPIRVQSPPGSRSSYSGGGYVVTQLLMTDSTAKPFPEVMRNLVLAPVGMADSTFEQPLPVRLTASAATGHLFSGKPVPGKWHVYPEMAAAGLWTTPRDLARLAIAVMRASQAAPDAIVSKSAAASMLNAQIADRSLGWEVDGEGKARSFGHGGANEGYGAVMIAYPETCQGAAVMTNADGGRLLVNEVLRAIADTYHWADAMPSAEQERIGVTPAIITRFAGAYRLKDVTLEIAADKVGGLTLSWEGLTSEPLLASPNGLFAPDSGLVVETKEAAAASAQTLTLYYVETNTGKYEAARIAP